MCVLGIMTISLLTSLCIFYLCQIKIKLIKYAVFTISSIIRMSNVVEFKKRLAPFIDVKLMYQVFF